MPLIKAKQKQEKEQIRISIENRILEKIREYCEWAGISKQDEFFEQAAEFVLSKDKEWLTHHYKKSEKRQTCRTYTAAQNTGRARLT